MNSEAKIMELIDWNKSTEAQDYGRKLARQVEDISVFVQPLTPLYNKNVWQNCAIILSERKDDELEPYLGRLLEWLQDMTWPGAACIMERIIEFNNKSFLMNMVDLYLRKAEISNDQVWEENLRIVVKRQQL